MTTYLAQVAAGILLAWGIYRLAMRGKAAAKTNRFFLLGGLILPFFLPLVPLAPILVKTAEPIFLPTITVDGNVLAGVASKATYTWVQYLYLGGVLAMLLYNLSGFLTVLRLRKNAARVDESSKVFIVKKATMPFSFFGSIYLPAALTKAQQDLIIAHEQKHIKCKHSADVLFGACIQSVLWFLPIMPFYLRDLRLEHEYEVDQLMLNETTFTHYAENLLEVSLMPIHHVNFHSFSSPKLKNRIIMMTKKHKTQTWKLLFLIPVACSLIYLNACTKQEKEPVVEGKLNTLKMAEVDKVPLFPNCDANATTEEMKQCFNQGIINQVINNMSYPESAKSAGAEGKVFVQFIVDTDGELKNISVLKSKINSNDEAVIKDLEQAALEVFNEFPGLEPAKKDGNSVAIEYIVPIRFALPDEE